MQMQPENSPENFSIREAVEEDLPDLVQLHVTSWNATYPGYHPKPTPALRTSQWRKAFREKEDNWFCFVAVDPKDDIVGFATGNDFHEPTLPYEAQLNKIHFYKAYQRMGLGRRLFGQVVRRFLQARKTSMILFADPQNPNIRFYERLQGQRLLDPQGIFQGAYGWSDISLLVKNGIV